MPAPDQLEKLSPYAIRQAVLKDLSFAIQTSRHIPAEALRGLIRKRAPSLIDTFFREGVMAAVREYERAGAPVREMSYTERTRRSQSRARNSVIIAEAKAQGVAPAKLVRAKLDEHQQIVALLDNWIIGNRRLGDCSKLDLLAAAARERVSEDTARCRADVYEGLAGKLGVDETVAGVKDRAGILDLIRPLLAA